MAALEYFRIAYANKVPAATITSSSEATGFADDNVADQNRQTFYRPSGTPAVTEWVKFDLGAAHALKFIAHLNHNFKAHGITNVQLKYGTAADDGSTWDTVAFTWNPVSEASDFDKFHVFTEATKRWWLYVIDTVTTNPSIGQIFLGKIASFQYGFTWPDTRISDHGVAIDESEGGYDTAEQYGTLRQTIILNGPQMTNTERESLVTIDDWHKSGLNPIALVDVDQEEAAGECIYGRFLGPLAHTRHFPDNSEVRHTFRQVL